MRNLRLVKTLTRLKEEREHAEEVLLESAGLVFSRGVLAEIVGGAGSGKSSILLSLLAKSTQAGEVCAVVDSSDGFDPGSAVLSGVELENLLWVRCGGNLEKAFMSADYLVQAKGFGVVWLNLNGLSKRELRQVPKTYWYRYRTRIRDTPTMLFVTAEEPVAGSAAQQAFSFSCEEVKWSGIGRFKLLKALHLKLHSRKELYGKPLLTHVEFDHEEV